MKLGSFFRRREAARISCSLDELLERFLQAYSVYYDVAREADGSPFDAEARFSAREAQYALLKAAKISETLSHERVYFAKRERLAVEELDRLHALAWERGLAEVRPGPDHKNTDVALIVLAGSVDAEIKKRMKRYAHSKTYKLGLWGYSNYRLAIIEHSTGAAFFNRQGRSLRGLVEDILYRNH